MSFSNSSYISSAVVVDVDFDVVADDDVDVAADVGADVVSVDEDDVAESPAGVMHGGIFNGVVGGIET